MAQEGLCAALWNLVACPVSLDYALGHNAGPSAPSGEGDGAAWSYGGGPGDGNGQGNGDTVVSSCSITGSGYGCGDGLYIGHPTFEKDPLSCIPWLQAGLADEDGNGVFDHREEDWES